MTTPTAELAELTLLLNTPGLSELLVYVAIPGQVQLEAEGSSYLDVVKVIINAGETRDILQDAPAEWWANSSSLTNAVANGWLQVVTEPVPVTAPLPPPPPPPPVPTTTTTEEESFSSSSFAVPLFSPTAAPGDSKPTTTAEVAELTQLLNTPGLQALPVMGLITGQVQIEATGDDYLDTVKVVVSYNYVVDLLQYAPQSWWVNSISLFSAVSNGWVGVSSQTTTVSSLVVVQETIEFIPKPANAVAGDLLVFDGVNWIRLPTGLPGQVLTSGGANTIPSYQEPQSSSAITGQVTLGLFIGAVCYLTGNNVWQLASADNSLGEALAGGVYGGQVGSMFIPGSTVDVRCTTDDGPPAPNSRLYLAMASADGGFGMGKVTPVPPEPTLGNGMNLTTVGICIDNTSYASSKLVRAVFQPAYPVILFG